MNRSIAACFALFFGLMAMGSLGFAVVAFPFGSTESLLMLGIAIGNVLLTISASLASH